MFGKLMFLVGFVVCLTEISSLRCHEGNVVKQEHWTKEGEKEGYRANEHFHLVTCPNATSCHMEVFKNYHPSGSKVSGAIFSCSDQRCHPYRNRIHQYENWHEIKYCCNSWDYCNSKAKYRKIAEYLNIAAWVN